MINIDQALHTKPSLGTASKASTFSVTNSLICWGFMVEPTLTNTTSKHIRLLVIFAFASRVLTLVLLGLSSFLPLFDSSPKIITHTKWILRWDVFHFAHIAEKGYVYEYEWAFFPGTSLLMRFTAELLHLAKGSKGALTMDDFLIGGSLAALACDTSRTMYHLSLHHLGSPSLAFLASLLSLLPSSPATLRSTAYSEPFFTYLSYKGMLYCARSQWFAASILFALAGTFRSNGILLSGFIFWGLNLQPILDGKKFFIKNLSYSFLLCGIIFAPLIYHQYAAYAAFCTQSQSASWCSNFPPSIYSHVQATYWNVGFLRYWTLQQLPNFVISAPPFMALFYFCCFHVKHSLIPQIYSKVSSNLPKEGPQEYPPSKSSGYSDLHTSSFLSHSLTPHVIHALFLCATLLFASHTQIILRLGPSMPITYWSAAWMLVARRPWGRWWIAWSVIWGAISLVLWGTFLPPA